MEYHILINICAIFGVATAVGGSAQVFFLQSKWIEFDDFIKNPTIPQLNEFLQKHNID